MTERVSSGLTWRGLETIYGEASAELGRARALIGKALAVDIGKRRGRIFDTPFPGTRWIISPQASATQWLS
jgi:hypothetical protein